MLYAFVAAILFGSKAIFAKLAYSTGVPISDLLFLRFGMAIPILYYFFKKNNSHLLASPLSSRYNICVGVIVTSLLFSAATICDFEAIHHLPVSIERMVIFTYPVVILIFETIKTKNKIKPHNVISFFLMYIGLSFVIELNILHLFSDKNHFNYSLVGVLLALLSSLTYAGYLISSKKVIEQIGSLALTSYINTVAFCVVSIYYFKGITNGLQISSKGFLYAISITVFSTVIPYLMIFEAIKKIGASATGIISMISPVATLGAAYLFLNEKISYYQLFGSTLILAGVTTMKIFSLRDKNTLFRNPKITNKTH